MSTESSSGVTPERLTVRHRCGAGGPASHGGVVATPNQRIRTAAATTPCGRWVGWGDNSPSAWVAECWVVAGGRKACATDGGSVGLFAVSVHSSFPSATEQRLRLLEWIGDHLQGRNTVDRPTLCVLPGGFLGFQPVRVGRRVEAAWLELGSEDVAHLGPRLLQAVQRFPAECTVIMGIDTEAGRTQRAHVFSSDGAQKAVVTRGRTELQGRLFAVGSLNVSVFICGEFTGSTTAQNRPFHGSGRNAQYLRDPARQLPTTDVLVDLAHLRVKLEKPRTGNRRQVHQLQMERFSERGAAVLTHHHDGVLAGRGRPHVACRSNWIIVQGGAWLPEDCVGAPVAEPNEQGVLATNS